MIPQIVKRPPPNYDELAERFPIRGRSVIFAYDGLIYNPSCISIPPALVVHEVAHLEEQDMIGVDEWWELYMDDPEFRLRQEIIGHRAEYRCLKEFGGNRHQRRSAIKEVAAKLASPLYGSLITKRRAEVALKGVGEA